MEALMIALKNSGSLPAESIEELKKQIRVLVWLESEYENVIMPKKKPKGRELTERQKISNKNISRVRVKIENAFAGVKRLRIVYNVSRTRRDQFIDQTFSVACGLWNFYLATK